MGMPWPQLRFKSHLERSFLNTFVELKEMRMTGADANPDYLHDAFWRKSSNSFNRQEERAKFNRLEFFAQAELDVLRHAWEKTEREMNLIDRGPADPMNTRIKIEQ